jgi:hypothetical protein
MLFDAYYDAPARTVLVSGLVDGEEKTIKFHADDMAKHSAAWFVNQVLSLSNSEELE